MSEKQKGNIIIYQPEDGNTKIDVHLENENIWLTQKMMAELFQTTPQNITIHLKNIFDEGELQEDSTCKNFLQVQTEGSRQVERKQKFYNLDAIISVGYRINPTQGSKFTTWAEEILSKNNNHQVTVKQAVNDKIFVLRGVAVMLDKHLAEFYQTETRTLKQTVKRNIARFPSDFMFELNDDDINSLVSQSVIPNSNYFGGAKPFVFTEQGVSMLSAVIRTKVAVEVSIKIIRAFVEVKKLVLNKHKTHQRLSNLEQKQLETDNKINQMFEAINNKELTPNQGVFFDGQIFDAYALVANFIRSANTKIILIDNYVDDTVLTLFSKKKKNVECTIYTKSISKQLKQDANKFNQQYGKLILNTFNKSHDRFLIIDNKQIYHIGASLKDLGRKWFAFTKMDESSLKILEYLK